MSETGGPLRRALRKIMPGGEYTTDEADQVELETVEPDAAMVPEAEQHGDPAHEGAPDGGF